MADQASDSTNEGHQSQTNGATSGSGTNSESSTNFSIPQNIFRNLVLEISSGLSEDMSFEDNAIAALQTASEAFLVWVFEKSGLAASHVERKTVKKEDLDLILSLNNID